jgi:signal transduction histidine kinase
MCIRDRLNGYRRLLERLFDKVSALRRQVKVLDVIFVDPYNSIIKMRTALHELSNILEQQESSARGIIEFKDIETTRAKYFKGLHSIFGEHLDPFDRIKAAYPQIWIKIPKRRIHIPNAETIQSILHHLVQNSIKSGAQEIIIQVLRRNSRIVTIAVIDDGPGIPAEILPHLFTPIQTTKGEGHAGLGLTIVKNLVNELHGSISCRSSDKGTSFHILLPRNIQN